MENVCLKIAALLALPQSRQETVSKVNEMINKSVQRMVGTLAGTPDFFIPEFVCPQLPEDVLTRFPSLGNWRNEFDDQHRVWRENLQRSIQRSFQPLQAAPTKSP